jgi:hypothetical protein
VADRRQTFTVREGDVLPRQGAQFLDPQPGVEQEPDDGEVARLPRAFDGAEQGVLLTAVEPPRPGLFLRNGPGTAPGSILGRDREARGLRPGKRRRRGGGSSGWRRSQSASVTSGFMACPPPVPEITLRFAKEQPACHSSIFSERSYDR